MITESSTDFADYTEEKSEPRKGTRSTKEKLKNIMGSNDAESFCAFGAFSWLNVSPFPSL
jgi:hypothetical protein